MSMSIDNSSDFFVKDFYRRTLQNLDDYHGDYEVTLLINSMVGLLIVPKETYFTKNPLPDTYVNSDLLIKIQNSIKKNTINEKPNPNNSLQEIVRRMRNAVAHGRLTIHGEKPVNKNRTTDIKSISFVDKDTTKDKSTNQVIVSYFEAEIEIELLKDFLRDFIINVCNDADKKVVSK